MKKLAKLVHIDFKDAPVHLDLIKELIPVLKKYGMSDLLLECEDMFPYSDYISFLAYLDGYSEKELSEFLELCKEQDLNVVPLVQTFDYMEFVLKYERMRHLRENFNHPMTICPSLNDSINLIKGIINQILNLHPDSEYLHLGADSVLEINVCQGCQDNNLDLSRLFLQHIISISGFVKKSKGIQPIMWDDMLRDIDSNLIKAIKLNSYFELMIWNYDPLLEIADDIFNMMLSIFPRIWAVSTLKGADGAQQQIVNTSIYIENNQSWCPKIKSLNQGIQGKFVEIALTGWSRFDHFAPLCELLPASIPCLIVCLEIVNSCVFTAEIHDGVSNEHGFPGLIP